MMKQLHCKGDPKEVYSETLLHDLTAGNYLHVCIVRGDSLGKVLIT